DDKGAVSTQLQRLTLPDFVKTQFIFENSPVCLYDGTEPDPEEMRNGTQSSQPGSRAPHGWLADGEAIFDRFGPDFTLLRFGAADADVESLVAAAADAGLPLTVCDIPNGDLAALYERRLVLVRPDGHVAWRANHAPDDAIALIDIVRGAG
ncbi:MAG: aromatic-ring hydroxylase C-terminal domain-containing protein, partial [Alphaproteobacteria bacterium]